MSCSPAAESSVRELGQFSQGQCTSTSMTGAMGLQMTLLSVGQGSTMAPTNNTEEIITARKKNHRIIHYSLVLSSIFLGPPGLWKSVAGAHSHSRKTVDHFLYCSLVRKVEHN